MATIPPPPPVVPTLRLSVRVRVKPPAVPEIVTLLVPVAAVLEAANVSVLLVLAAGFGLKLAVTPDGKPDTLKFTELAKPPVRATDTETVPLALRLRVRLVGLVERLKSGEVVPRKIAANAGNHLLAILTLPEEFGCTPSTVSAALLNPVH